MVLNILEHGEMTSKRAKALRLGLMEATTKGNMSKVRKMG